jgi:hypothetical protein
MCRSTPDNMSADAAVAMMRRSSRPLMAKPPRQAQHDRGGDVLGRQASITRGERRHDDQAVGQWQLRGEQLGLDDQQRHDQDAGGAPDPHHRPRPEVAASENLAGEEHDDADHELGDVEGQQLAGERDDGGDRQEDDESAGQGEGLWDVAPRDAARIASYGSSLSG